MAKFIQGDPFFSHSLTSNIQRISRIHFHPRHELYYLTDGTTKYLVEERPFFLQKGNLIFIPKGILHSNDSEECLNTKRILLSFEDDIIPDKYRPLIEELAQDNIIYIPEEHLPKIDAIYEKIEREYNAGDIYSQELCDLYVIELITLIARLRQKDQKLNLSEQDALFYKIAKYIQKNYPKNITLQSLSEQFAISRSYLCRRFKKILGIGVNDYITYVRIFHAEEFLRTTNYSIAKIAQDCGYNDGNYFVTVFKRAKGITPFQYRKQYFESE